MVIAVQSGRQPMGRPDTRAGRARGAAMNKEKRYIIYNRTDGTSTTDRKGEDRTAREGTGARAERHALPVLQAILVRKASNRLPDEEIRRSVQGREVSRSGRLVQHLAVLLVGHPSHRFVRVARQVRHRPAPGPHERIRH